VFVVVNTQKQAVISMTAAILYCFIWRKVSVVRKVLRKGQMDWRACAAGFAVGAFTSWTVSNRHTSARGVAEKEAQSRATAAAATQSIHATTENEKWVSLINLAIDVKQHSACKCSGYSVGAALSFGGVAGGEKVFTGVNYESDSYGLCLCAGRL
jgi:hypothetical protein